MGRHDQERNMNMQHMLSRPIGLAAAATLTLGLATAGPAGAAVPPHPSASVAHDTLTILGTNGGDEIQLEVPTADPNTLLVHLGNGTRPQSFDRNSFSAIAVFLRGGDDQFSVLNNGASLVGDSLIVDGGRGNDTITGGDGNDLIFGGSGADHVDGGRGNDTQILGAGTDTALWNPGEGSDVTDGGTGYDTLVFNGSSGDEVMSLSANGHHAVFLRNLGSIRMDMNRVEALDLAALGGVDTVTVNDLRGTDVRSANIDLSSQGAGDRADDVVTVNGTNRADRIHVAAYHGVVDVAGLRARTVISGSEPTDRLQVNSLGGNDHVKVRDTATALIGVAVDLGTGQR
jgi:Ca2+-binding RTX toxin-like protein